jgi:hypothetical protein
MAREDVEKYLSLRHLDYHAVRIGGSSDLTYEIKIGEEDGFICESDVYVALEISVADTLREIHLRRSETCL